MPLMIYRFVLCVWVAMGSLPVLAGKRPLRPKPQQLLIIKAEFEDKEFGRSDAEWTRTWKALVKKLDAYWVGHSYGMISEITAEQTDRLLLPGTSADYVDVHALNAAMRKAAKAAGYNLGKFDHCVLSYPGIKHNISFGGLGTPGTMWMPGEKPYDGGFIHEFGHALGVGHASAFEGGDVAYPGAHREGRDGLFMMGSDGQGRIGDFSTINLPMRYKLGFLDDTHLPHARGNRTYRIYNFERDTLRGRRVVGVRVAVDDKEFWISYAPLMAKRWSKFDADGFKKGVIVHQFEGGITRTIDFTPGSQGEGNTADYFDTRDGALVIGNVFVFPDTDISIEPLKVGETGGWKWIEVRVRMKG